MMYKHSRTLTFALVVLVAVALVVDAAADNLAKDRTREDGMRPVPPAQSASTAALESCGCGNLDCDSAGVVDISDVMKLLDFFYINWNPINEEDANVDGCDGVDIADLVLFLEHHRTDYTSPSFCSGTVDCNYAPPGDSIAVEVVYAPNAAAHDSTMRLDVYGRNARRLAAIQVAFRLDGPELVQDSAVLHPLIDTAFYYREPSSIYFWPWYGQDVMHVQTTAFTPDGGSGLAPDATQMRLWASFYLTVHGWTETDSIVVDTVMSTGSLRNFGKLVKWPYDGSGADSLGYYPAWGGPVIVRNQDGCCGLYTGGYPGNTNCDEMGKITLADISKLIDRVYISKTPLCCEANGDVNCDGRINLADITCQIGMVYNVGPPCGCYCWQQP